MLLGVATHKLSRFITKDKVTRPIRAPFTEVEGRGAPGELEEQPRGKGARVAIGELLSCPFCLDAWVANGFVSGTLFAPRVTRAVASLFVVVAISDSCTSSTGGSSGACSRHRVSVVVITGGSAGVGRATARAFARRGLGGRHRARPRATGGDGTRIEAVVVAPPGRCRRGGEVAVEAAAEALEHDLGPIDVWVNNAMATIFARSPTYRRRSTGVRRR